MAKQITTKSPKEIIGAAKAPSVADLGSQTDELKVFDETDAEVIEDHKDSIKLHEAITRAKQLKLELEKSEIENQRLRIENNHTEKINELRIEYTGKIVNRVVWFLGVVLAIIIANGIGWLKLSDVVLNTLLGSSVVEVIGILVIVAKWLFPNTNDKK